MTFTSASDDFIYVSDIFKVTLAVLPGKDGCYLVGPYGEMVRVTVDEGGNLEIEWQELVES